MLIRAKRNSDYTASRNIWQLKVFVLLFHIESSLLLAWEQNTNMADLNAVKIVSSGAFKETEVKKL